MMSQLIDGLMLLLLVGTLGYAFLVDRRVRKLMTALSDLEPMVGRFSEAVDKSETSVSALRTATDDMSEAKSRAASGGERVGLMRKRVPPQAEPARAGQKPEPKLRKPQPAAQPSAERPASESDTDRRAQPQRRRTAPVAGGKSDLVRQFFETSRSSEA